jgi:putative phage-type endonuclease
VIEVVQGTPEWHAVRLGKVTASRVADVIARTKTGYGASRANYMAELICERLTGSAAERFTNAAMAWGTEREPEARELYEFQTDAEVSQVGFAAHPTIAMTGASPDGLVGSDGMVEIKCPNTATHLETLEGQTVPAKYVTQMLWQMACTGRAWCDFVSFDPRLPAHMRLFVKRVPRDDARLAEIEAEVRAFLAELDAKIARLDAIYGQRAAA